MIYKITIHDNDFYNLMNLIMDYVCKIFYCYKNLYQEQERFSSDEDLIKDCIMEYLEIVYTQKDIVDYILKRLRIEKVHSYTPENENSEIYYFFGKSFILN